MTHSTAAAARPRGGRTPSPSQPEEQQHMTDTNQTGPAREGSTERCANDGCGHTKRDHSGRRDHTTKHPDIPLRPWCHACATDCLYEPPAAVSAPVPPAPADRAAIIAELLPAWEAMYEPGNVSDYLIGYANDEAAAKGAAEAWLRSQAEVTGRLEWVPQTPLDGYDQEAELVERHDDGIDTGPGITIRRRVEPAAVSQPETEA